MFNWYTKSEKKTIASTACENTELLSDTVLHQRLSSGVQHTQTATAFEGQMQSGRGSVSPH